MISTRLAALIAVVSLGALAVYRVRLRNRIATALETVADKGIRIGFENGWEAAMEEVQQDQGGPTAELDAEFVANQRRAAGMQ